MMRAVLLAALLACAVASAAAGSPRKLLDATNQAGQLPDQAKKAMQEAQKNVQDRMAGMGMGIGTQQQQQQLQEVANQAATTTGPRSQSNLPLGPSITSPGSASINPDADKVLEATPGPVGSDNLSVDEIAPLLGNLQTFSASETKASSLPTLLASAKGISAARAGNAIAVSFTKATVKDGVADAVAKGFVQAGCQGGTNVALSISLANAAVVAGRPFVNSFNTALARQFPASRCSRCYTKTISDANTIAQSLGGKDGFSSASSINFALGVCLP